eukprot:SAG31_NODE_4081_length_3608_cov_3.369336_5_plen_67_part_00
MLSQFDVEAGRRVNGSAPSSRSKYRARGHEDGRALVSDWEDRGGWNDDEHDEEEDPPLWHQVQKNC